MNNNAVFTLSWEVCYFAINAINVINAIFTLSCEVMLFWLCLGRFAILLLLFSLSLGSCAILLFMLLMFSLCFGSCYFAINAINAIFTLFRKVCYFAIYSTSTLSWEVCYFAINARLIFLGGVIFLFILFSLCLGKCAILLLILLMLFSLFSWEVCYFAISVIFIFSGGVQLCY